MSSVPRVPVPVKNAEIDPIGFALRGLYEVFASMPNEDLTPQKALGELIHQTGKFPSATEDDMVKLLNHLAGPNYGVLECVSMPTRNQLTSEMISQWRFRLRPGA